MAREVLPVRWATSSVPYARRQAKSRVVGKSHRVPPSLLLREKPGASWALSATGSRVESGVLPYLQVPAQLAMPVRTISFSAFRFG